MSNIRISRPAVQNPTGLTPVAGYNKPATNTIGDFARKQGITFTGQQDALSALEQRLVKNKELAEKFKGTRYEKVYRAQVEKIEKQLAEQKAAAPAPAAKPFNQSLNERITAQMGQNPQYGGKTVKIGDKYVAQSAQDTRELAELNKALDARDAANAAKKAQETEQAWQQYANAPKGQQHYDEVFKYRQAEREAQDAIARGFKPQPGNPAVPSTTYRPQGGAAVAGSNLPKPQGPTVHTVYQPPKISAETIDAGLGIGKTPKSAQESMGVFVKRGIEDATKDVGNITARSVEEGLGLRNIPKSAMESAGVFEEAGMLGENIGKQKGFWGKLGGWLKDKAGAVGDFLKKHGGKLAIAAAVIGLGALLLKNCTGNKDKTPATPVVPPEPTKPTNPTPVVPVDPTEPDEPADKPIHEDGAPEPNYTLKAKYCGMSQYVAAAYGVDEGSEKHKQIMEKLWEVNPGLRNKTLAIGDKVYLPDVEIDGETVTPDLDAQPGKGKKGNDNLEKYNGYTGKNVYGVGEEHDDNANQYHDTDRQKVQDKANEAA